MSGIEFEEDNSEFHIKSRTLLGEADTPAMIKFLLKSGVAKNEKQALIILVVVILITLSTAIFVLLGRGNTREAYVVDEYGVRYEMEEYVRLVDEGRDPLRR